MRNIIQANSLAETINEKEIALENFKKINKDLMKRISDLEGKNK